MRVLILVPELDGDAIVGESKELLAQPVVFFFLPFLCEELDDGIATLEEGVPVSPLGI